MTDPTHRGLHRSQAAALSLLALLVPAAGCSSVDLGAWRAACPPPRSAAERGEASLENRQVEELRARLDLAASRHLALTLAAERPQDGAALTRASRAEADQVFLLPEEDKERRGLAARSSLDYAEQASRLPGGDGVAAQAQLAWALGTTTHLQPMMGRSAHARRTLEVIDRALQLDPDNTTALATLAILRLRLATLPWIARAMAWGAPEGSIDEAIDRATRCVALQPSLQHRLLLARALLAGERRDDAIGVLRVAAAATDSYPRDREIRPEVVRLLGSLEEGK